MEFSFKKVLLVYVAVLAALLASSAFATQGTDGVPLTVSFLDIGQGDATLIQYLGQYQILVDGGPDGNKLLSELGKAMPPADKQIEIVVLTHPDQDHLAGLIDVAQNYEVGLFLDNGQKADTDIFAELEEQLNEKKIERKTIAEGSRMAIGEYLKLSAFNPDEPAGGDERNDQSVVLRVDFGDNSFLLTGDAEFGAEKDMIGDGEDVDVDWLKVGHHGSKSSTSEEFLTQTTPKCAIISAGRSNRYGHPHEETLTRLASQNINVLRTDQQGTITIECINPQATCGIKQK